MTYRLNLASDKVPSARSFCIYYADKEIKSLSSVTFYRAGERKRQGPEESDPRRGEGQEGAGERGEEARGGD